MPIFTTVFKCARASFFALTILLSTISIGTPIIVNAQTASVETLRNIGVWNQKYAAIVGGVTGLYDMEKINIMLEAINNIDDDYAAFDTAFKEWSETVDNNIRDLGKLATTFPDPPNIPAFKEIHTSLVEKKHSVAPMVDAAIESVLHMKTGLSRVRRGDATGVTQIWIAQQDAAGHAIKAELTVIKSALTVLKPDNPAYHFQILLLAESFFMLNEIEITKLSLLDQSTLEDRQPFVEQMQKELAIFQRHIPMGYQSIKVMQNKLRKESKEFKNSQNTYNDIIAITGSYKEAFDIESTIVKVHHKSITAYSEDRPIDEIDSATNQINDEYFSLLNQRHTLYNQRTNRLANLGK